MDRLLNKPINIPNLTRIEVPDLPDLPFRGIFVGGSGTGKTNSIVNFVNFYKQRGLLDNITVICPTKDLKLVSLVESPEDYYLSPTFETIQTIISKIKGRVQEYKSQQKDIERWKVLSRKREEDLTTEDLIWIEKQPELPPKDTFGHFPRSLLIIDDSIGTQLFGLQRKNPLVNFYIRSRHYGCSIILSTQYFNSLNKALRANASFYVLFKNKDKKQLASIYAEIASHCPMEQFIEMFDSATAEKYHFLFIDLEKGEFREDFNRRLL